MRKYLAQRLLIAVPTLLGVTLLVNALAQLLLKTFAGSTQAHH